MWMVVMPEQGFLPGGQRFFGEQRYALPLPGRR